jgi:hypothetical protein
MSSTKAHLKRLSTSFGLKSSTLELTLPSDTYLNVFLLVNSWLNEQITSANKEVNGDRHGDLAPPVSLHGISPPSCPPPLPPSPVKVTSYSYRFSWISLALECDSFSLWWVSDSASQLWSERFLPYCFDRSMQILVIGALCGIDLANNIGWCCGCF